ncbi:hypothetical protein BACI349Y_100060 [Bacillus sp. 349Y]|nr:hypothetical protein BACI349Y_100060 [Bacillus sp. 349Y]
MGLLSVNWLFHRSIVIPEVESGINQRGTVSFIYGIDLYYLVGKKGYHVSIFS